MKDYEYHDINNDEQMQRALENSVEDYKNKEEDDQKNNLLYESLRIKHNREVVKIFVDGKCMYESILDHSNDYQNISYIMLKI